MGSSRTRLGQQGLAEGGGGFLPGLELSSEEVGFDVKGTAQAVIHTSEVPHGHRRVRWHQPAEPLPSPCAASQGWGREEGERRKPKSPEVLCLSEDLARCFSLHCGS